MGAIREVSHAIARHYMTIARDKRSDSVQFQNAFSRLADILACETTRLLPGTDSAVETPLERASGFVLNRNIGLIPILRAGLALVESHTRLIPTAKVFHLGMYRDEHTAQPISYYNKLEEYNRVETALILDPMLATGGSAKAAIAALRTWGVGRIQIGSLIAAPEGLAAVQEFDPEVDITVCVIDRQLDDNQFICPGLGDAGDRFFGTE